MSIMFTPDQEAEIARIAEILAAAGVAQALNGAAERIVSVLIIGSIRTLPLFHMTDIAAQSGTASSGKVTGVTGGSL